MPRPYSPEEKAQALDLLHEKDGDVPYVSYLTGISERTLYSWRKYLKYENAALSQTDPEADAQPQHWVRQHPERQARLQQQQEKRLQQQQRGVQSLRAADSHQMTAFGITYEELEEALNPEFIDSPYTNLHADLLLHLQHLNFSLTDEPETAHRKALAFTRILDNALKLEAIVKVEKPQLSLFKYEYPDKTYHDIPFWSNAIHERATLAYDAVVAEAKRQYEEQQANPSPEAEPITPPDSDDSSPEDSDYDNYTDFSEASLEELINTPFKPEDFIPKNTGIHKYLFGEDPYSPKHPPTT